jgi:RNA polymerase sigma-70 factor (ECF subfamily)
MRKSVPTGPVPDTDTHVRGEEQADAAKTAGASRRGRAEGEPGAVTTANSAAGPVSASASIGPDDEANLNDAWLVERARHGDHAAFAILVRRYERKLIRVLARLVRDPELARDLAQETFWRVYSRLEGFDTARRFGPWLFRVAVNLGLDWLRRSRSEPSPPASIDRPHGHGQLPFELPDPDPRIQTELAQEVQYVLAQLPVSYRTILVLRDLEGFSSSEVAAIVGRREATVRWRLSKAREKFRELWQRRQEGAQREVKNG